MIRKGVLAVALVLLVVGGGASYGYFRIKAGAAPAGSASVGLLPDPRDAGTQENPSDAGPSEIIEVLPFDGELLDAAGRRDFGNRYLSTVVVSLQVPSEGADCSGVIIGPRQVLTAAHCVCKPERSPPDKANPEVVDSTHCLGRAYAATVRYGTVINRLTANYELLIYGGSVRPHPDFKMVYDPNGAVSTVNADLAMIVLDTPLVEEGLPALSILGEELQEQETLVMAGYGHGENGRGGFHRYFRSNKVVGPEGVSKDRFLYEQQGAFLYNGFDGGPCFRERGAERWLAGIASVGSDKTLTLTSTFAYRAWIRAELQRTSP